VQAHTKWQRLIQRSFPQLSRGPATAPTAQSTARNTNPPSATATSNANYGSRANRQPSQPANRGGRTNGGGARGGAGSNNSARNNNNTSRVTPRPSNAGPPAKVNSHLNYLNVRIVGNFRTKIVPKIKRFCSFCPQTGLRLRIGN
jgi:hypothetical protein